MIFFICMHINYYYLLRKITFETPIFSLKSLIDSAVYPLLLNPEIVGIRGSSQPVTIFLSTNSFKYRLLSTVYERFRRANSIYLEGNKSPGIFYKNQS